MNPSWTSVPTATFEVFLSGDRQTIDATCQAFCFSKGLCVSIESVSFVFTGGREEGAVVRLVSYPRFPASPEEIQETAKHLAVELLTACHQLSALVVGPDLTEWVSRRPDA